MNIYYQILGREKACEICEQYGLSRKEKVILEDVFTRLAEVEKFLETQDEETILHARTDVIGTMLEGNRNSRALFYAIVSICDEFRRIRDTVYQLRYLNKKGILLH